MNVEVGDLLPPLALDMTATRIVAGALATRDFMPLHHDRAYANHQGAPDILMNMLSTNAYCSRFVTDWAGPDAIVRRLVTRLGVPAYPGAPLRFTGAVTEVAVEHGETVVEVAIRGANELGDHVTGTVSVSLPAAR